MKILQRLYNSEINFSISTFWDGGFTFKLGDEMNGFKEEANFRTFDEGLIWLNGVACKHYPDSLYATGKYPATYNTREENGASGE